MLFDILTSLISLCDLRTRKSQLICMYVCRMWSQTHVPEKLSCLCRQESDFVQSNWYFLHLGYSYLTDTFYLLCARYYFKHFTNNLFRVIEVLWGGRFYYSIPLSLILLFYIQVAAYRQMLVAASSLRKIPWRKSQLCLIADALLFQKAGKVPPWFELAGQTPAVSVGTDFDRFRPRLEMILIQVAFESVESQSLWQFQPTLSSGIMCSRRVNCVAPESP